MSLRQTTEMLRFPRTAAARRGMTLIELMAALAILALLIGIARPVVNGFSARWQLRSAAHQVAGVVRWAQNAASAHRRTTEVLYDVPRGSFWVRVGDKSYSFKRLPGAVRFESVSFGEIEVVNDRALCRVYPDGTLDRHDVTLTRDDKMRIRISFNRLTGEADFEEEADGFRP